MSYQTDVHGRILPTRVRSKRDFCRQKPLAVLTAGEPLRDLRFQKVIKFVKMSRPKSQDNKLLLNHVLRIRIDQATLEKLQKIVKDSDCRNPCAAARKILSGERINIFYRDDSMTGVMEELALIRREIRSIGININQQTHHFHTTASTSEKWFYVNRTLIQYKSIEDKIDSLLRIVNQLSVKWLQES